MYTGSTVEETRRAVSGDIRKGLTQEEAARRLKRNGRNELPSARKKTWPEAFLEQLNDPLIYVLIGAAAVSVFLKEISDAVIIGVVVCVNAAAGLIQEGKARRALDSLKALASPHALVIRDGLKRRIPAAELAVGDLVCLEAGGQVPADLRLVRSSGLKTEESALTGESVPTEKDAAFLADGKEQPALGDRRNMAYMSTVVVGGHGEGLVTAVGADTEIGKIASMISESREELTPLQKRLGELGTVLSFLSLGLCAALFFIAVLQKRNVMDMLLAAISLAVAAVPEGLPAVVTICLALSVTRMVRVNTIIRKLPAVETLGAVSVVCSDKTGTLTQNKMTVEKCFLDLRELDMGMPSPISAADHEEFFRAIVLCNDAAWDGRKAIGDPTELSLLELAGKFGIRKEKLEERFPRCGELAFDSERKLMTTFHERGKIGGAVPSGSCASYARDAVPFGSCVSYARDAVPAGSCVSYARDAIPSGSCVSYTKGAPERLLERCNRILIHGQVVPLTALHRDRILEEVRRLSGEALRTLAAAMGDCVAPTGGRGARAEDWAVRMGDCVAPTGGCGARAGERAMKMGDRAVQAEKDLIFLGLLGMKDPPRPDAAEAVEIFRRAGVDTVMITGDHVDTALAVGRQLQIASDRGQCMTGKELEEISGEEFLNRLDRVRIFARVSPAQKVRIVKGFQQKGRIVAMTGDGINDAPSLKAADIGIAMGRNGTDVARQAADMILTDDHFATIEKAIEEGRGVYENIRKSVIFLLSSNLGEIMTMFVAVLCGIASPLRSSHILWINLITDSLPALALGVDRNDGKSLMEHPPRAARESLFSRGGLACTCFYGGLIASISLAAFLMLPLAHLHLEGLLPRMLSDWFRPDALRGVADALKAALSRPEILSRSQTYAFTVLSMSQLFHAIGMRDMKKSVFRMNPLENKWMLAAAGFGFALQFAVTEIPFLIRAFGTSHLDGKEWLLLICLSAFPLLAHEMLAFLGAAGRRMVQKKSDRARKPVFNGWFL